MKIKRIIESSKYPDCFALLIVNYNNKCLVRYYRYEYHFIQEMCVGYEAQVCELTRSVSYFLESELGRGNYDLVNEHGWSL